MGNPLKKKRIGIIGCGNMGEALVSGLLASRAITKQNLCGCEPRRERRNHLRKKYGLRFEKGAAATAAKSDIVVLAVKPQDIDTVLAEIAGSLRQGKLVVSIAAGITTGHIEGSCRAGIPVVRVMPNSPALVRKGVSGLCRGKYATRQHEKTVLEIFRVLGEVVFIREKLLNAVTAVSGGGPAYFYYLIESLVKAGKRCGLTRVDARKLVFLTAAGSIALLVESGKEPEMLRKAVTSKGGTTEAAFRVLEKRGFARMVEEAIVQAERRARELSRD